MTLQLYHCKGVHVVEGQGLDCRLEHFRVGLQIEKKESYSVIGCTAEISKAGGGLRG